MRTDITVCVISPWCRPTASACDSLRGCQNDSDRANGGHKVATVDSFPVLTGEVALETALRLHAGQKLPRVVATPQALVTKENMDRYTGDEAKVRKNLMEDAAAK